MRNTSHFYQAFVLHENNSNVAKEPWFIVQMLMFRSSLIVPYFDMYSQRPFVTKSLLYFSL